MCGSVRLWPSAQSLLHYFRNPVKHEHSDTDGVRRRMKKTVCERVQDE